MSGINKLTVFARDVRRTLLSKGRLITDLYPRRRYILHRRSARAIPFQALQGFEHKEVIEYFEWEKDQFKITTANRRHLDVKNALETEDTVFDLGGGLGQSFYAYKSYWNIPATCAGSSVM